MDKEFIADRLTELLKQRNITANKLSTMCDVSQTAISQIMRAKKCPTVETLNMLCVALDITLSEFFSDAEPEIKERFDALHQLVDEVPEERREEVRRFIEFTIQQHKREEGQL